MERLICKACGSESMVPMNVMLEDHDEDFQDDNFELLGGEQESRFYTCHVCGDNWLSVKEKSPGGECRITFIHQMGTSPQLMRVAHMETPILLGNDTVEEWEYFFGEDPVMEEDWRERLDDRREILRSICVN